MKYTEFGDTGVKVSKLGFGALHLPMTEVNGKEVVDYEKATKIMNKAFELGINYVDTAYGYCNETSEIAVGKALKNWNDNIYVATKNSVKNKSGSEWREKLEISLQRLDIEYIDFFHVWDLDWEQYQNMNVEGGPLTEAYRALEEGLINHLSFSTHDEPDNILKIIDTGYFESILLQYNILDRSNEKVIDYAHDKGLGVAVMGPVGGGKLAAPSTKLKSMMPEANSSVETALKFVWANKKVDIALSGMKNAKMVKENVKIATEAGDLSLDEKERIEAMVEENKKMLDLYCTGCEYCLPCPQGINIPEIFELRNYYEVYGLKEHAREKFIKLLEDAEKTSPDHCIECGQCEEKCPQNLKIIKKLKESSMVLK